MTSGALPDAHESAKNEGNAHKAAGDLERAAASYRRALELKPDYLPALYNLGMVLHETNRLEDAEAAFRRARAIDPADADVLAHLGAVLCKRKRFAEAAAAVREALRFAPQDANLWLWLARALRGLPGGVDEAIDAMRRAIALQPDFADACYELGTALRGKGDPQGAAGAFGRALELQPASEDAAEAMGGLLQEEGRLGEAIALYRAALRSAPGSAKVLNGLGCALTRTGGLAEAVARFREAIAAQPEFADAHNNLGIVLGMQGEREASLRCAEEAMRLKPGDPAIAECIQFEMQHLCDWRDFDARAAQQRQRAADPGARPSSPFSLVSIPSSRAEQLQSARAFARFHQDALGRDRPVFRFERGERARLRIGYLSADFHEHATAYLMAELFELHDRTRVEVLGYSYGPDDGSAMRGRLARAFDRFTDIAPLSHAAAAQAIHADRIDILVDLKGYTEHARTGILALRPAPVQVNYLGYPGTMGAPFIDYLVADRFVVPPAHAADYSEAVARLPGCYQVNDRQRRVAGTPARTDLGLPADGLVFCCFNQAYKILPETFSAWMRLLAAVPGSVLWLLDSNPWACRNLRAEAAARGVDPARLVFAPPLPLDRHLGRMRAADLFLDTWPCNAHTTASDALWAGLPLLTFAGETFASRVAGSLLHAAGLPELVAGSAAEYESLALMLARDPARLAGFRARLERDGRASALFDAPGFARHLESAYFEMWRNYATGTGPRPIDVAAGA